MYARKDIPTVLPDAVLRCRKLQTAANVELDEMEKTKYRRINTIHWQQQSFQRILNERHKRWRVYDRAFRLKLKRELGTDLATALRLRTIQDEEDKVRFEQELIEQSLAKQKKDFTNDDDDDDDDDDLEEEDEEEEEESIKTNPAVVTNQTVTKATSAHPKSIQIKVSINKENKSAIDSRRLQSAATKINPNESGEVKESSKLPLRRARTGRSDLKARRDTDPSAGLKHDFGSVLLRILSNIAATPDLDDDFTIRKRALEARERRLISTKDDRYFNLMKQLAPQKISGEKDPDDNPLILGE